METIIICFECRKRINAEEIQAGSHKHPEVSEPENPFETAAFGD